MRVATEFASALASHQRVMLWITSSALKVSPFDQVMPWRTFRVSVLASSLASQPSSSHGSKEKSRFQRTRYSLHWRAMLDISTPSKVRGSRNALMFMATRRVPPFTGVSAAWALRAVRPPRARAPVALTPSAAMVAKNSRRLVRPRLKSCATASAIGCRDRSVSIILVMSSSLSGRSGPFIGPIAVCCSCSGGSGGPLASAQCRHRRDDAVEPFRRSPRHAARAQIAVDESRFLAPRGAAAGSQDAVAIGFAVGGQRVALRSEDDRRRQAGEVAIGQRRHPRILDIAAGAEPDVAIEQDVAHAQHRRVGVRDIGAAAHVAAETGIDQDLADRGPRVAA